MISSIVAPHVSPLSARKEEILAEARRLMSERGYVATSMRDLAEALEIKPASLYSHYRSKEEMLWEIALECARAFHEQVIPLVSQSLSASERLGQMIRKHVEVVIELREASTIFFSEWRNLESTRKNTYSRYIKEYEAAFMTVIEQGVQMKEFREVQPAFAAYTILSSANWVHRWFRPDRNTTAETIAEEISEMNLRGLLPSISNNTDK